MKNPDGFFSLETNNFDWMFVTRLVINLITMMLLIRFVYYRVARRHEFFFTFFMFNLVIFIITTLLNSNSGFSIGAAFGLFAIFALLRYRTEDISPRDMTYLFLSITIGLISSINQGSVLEILIINGIILLAAFLIEGNVLIQPEFAKTVEFENVELIKPESREALLKELRNRTGLPIHKIDVRRIDYLRDIAVLKVYYHGEGD
ncbi:MAG TPA: DUF4956 domain-containing protein [Cryomorphaceae bacterium]|nr:DUF4956 domain-containing protein [Cryomorphaceae bacterium]